MLLQALQADGPQKSGRPRPAQRSDADRVSAVTASLIADGLTSEVERTASTGAGKPATLLGVEPDGRHVIPATLLVAASTPIMVVSERSATPTPASTWPPTNTSSGMSATAALDFANIRHSNARRWPVDVYRIAVANHQVTIVPTAEPVDDPVDDLLGIEREMPGNAMFPGISFGGGGRI